MFVNFCRDKLRLSWQKTCFVVTNMHLWWQMRVSWQNFCCDKNDTCGSSRQWYPPTFSRWGPPHLLGASPPFSCRFADAWYSTRRSNLQTGCPVFLRELFVPVGRGDIDSTSHTILTELCSPPRNFATDFGQTWSTLEYNAVGMFCLVPGIPPFYSKNGSHCFPHILKYIQRQQEPC